MFKKISLSLCLIIIFTSISACAVTKEDVTNETVKKNTSLNYKFPPVVHNSEVPEGMELCGVADRGQECLLYLANTERKAHKASFFYELASYLTGVHRFLIDEANSKYANIIIEPGHMCMINIPSFE